MPLDPTRRCVTRCARPLTQVQRVAVGPVGEGGALVHLIQQLLFHLCDCVTVQHFGGQRLALVHSAALHQNIQCLREKSGKDGVRG